MVTAVGDTVAARVDTTTTNPRDPRPPPANRSRSRADRRAGSGAPASVPLADPSPRLPVPGGARRARLPLVDPGGDVRRDLARERASRRAGADRHGQRRAGPGPRRGARRPAVRAGPGDRARGGGAGPRARSHVAARRLAGRRRAGRRVGHVPRRRLRVEPRVRGGLHRGRRGAGAPNPARHDRRRAPARRGRLDAPRVLRGGRRGARDRRHLGLDPRGPVPLELRRRARHRGAARRRRDRRRRLARRDGRRIPGSAGRPQPTPSCGRPVSCTPFAAPTWTASSSTGAGTPRS